MIKYRSRPIIIEATQFDGTQGSAEKIINWAKKDISWDWLHEGRADSLLCLLIETREGVMKATPGDYVIKGIIGEFYPCKPTVFKDKYEKVSE